MRRPLLVAALLLAVGCTPGLPSRQATGTCAETVVHAFSSPTAPVLGAFECLDPVQQGLARRAGVQSDADIQKIARKTPVYDTHYLVGRTRDGLQVWVMSGKDGETLMVTHVQASTGRVDYVDVQALHPPKP